MPMMFAVLHLDLSVSAPDIPCAPRYGVSLKISTGRACEISNAEQKYHACASLQVSSRGSNKQP